MLKVKRIFAVLFFALLLSVVNVEVYKVQANNDPLYGFSIKQPLSVYESPSRNSEVLKQYNYNSSLKFKKYSEQWYVVTVYISGVAYKGYINKADVAEDKDINNVYGLANKDLDVYTEATEESKIRKSYVQGSKLKFKNYNESWYTAVVYVNGVRYTGYIAHKDIELIDSTQMKMTGLANKQRTKIYSKASTNSSILKDYEYGHSLIYRSLSKNWYEATVYIKGKPETGYINKNDVTQKLNDFQYGYASTDKVNVYKSTSRKSDVLKSYQYGSELKYRYYNANWYIATVYIKGKKQIGFINAVDTGKAVKKLQGYAIKDKVHVYSNASRNSNSLKSYPKGSSLLFLPHDNTWYKAVVYIKGKKHTGFINMNDIGEELVDESSNKNNDLPILMYHQVDDNPKSHEYGLFVSPDNLREQMKYLKDNGYTLLNFDDIPTAQEYEKPIIITFDDGRANNMLAYNTLSELKDESFQPKATFFVVGNNIGLNTYLTEEEIKKVSDSDIISIQSHTMNHEHFNDAEVAEKVDIHEEIAESKMLLEEITGKRVSTLAYPYGAYNPNVIEETKKEYDYAVTTTYGIADLNDSHYELKRVRISFDTTIEQFSEMIK